MNINWDRLFDGGNKQDGEPSDEQLKQGAALMLQLYRALAANGATEQEIAGVFRAIVGAAGGPPRA